jgi:DNA repair protein RecO (recombination protein O)
LSELAFEDVLVTGLIPYGESDLVVRLLSRSRGRTAAFARGAKRSKKRFAGSLQLLARGKAGLKQRRGADLATLESLEATGVLFGLAEDPLRYGRAAYLVDITEKLVPEEEPVPELFDRLCASLERLAAGAADARLLRAYELLLLDDTGYLPDLLESSDDPAERGIALDPSSGELLAHPGPGAVPFDAAAQDAALALVQAPLHEPPDVDDDTLRVVGRLFASHLRRMGLKDLKTIQFLKALS